jgi:hypothetical protein
VSEEKPPSPGEEADELAERHAAKGLAEGLEGRVPNGAPEDLLGAAAQVASARVPALSPQAKARIAGALFDDAPRRARGARWMGAAAALAVSVGIGLGVASLRAPPSEPAASRASARELVVALFPKGSTPASRARAIAEGRASP